jgi:acyl carrier protein
MNKGEVRKRVEALVRKVHYASPGEAVAQDLPLLDKTGLFDSVMALQLVLSMEEEFGITVEDEDIKPENLRNLDSLVRFVESKFSRQ